MRTGRCLHCGKEFETDCETKKYCERRCKINAKNARKRAGILRTYLLYGKTCPECGEKFSTTNKRQFRCRVGCRKKTRKRSYVGTKAEKCEYCSYDNKLALHAHHINRTKGLGCITLCANCHYVFHGTCGQKRSEYERDTKAQIIDDLKKVL